jgi:hypothetical protein
VITDGKIVNLGVNFPFELVLKKFSTVVGDKTFSTTDEGFSVNLASGKSITRIRFWVIPN